MKRTKQLLNGLMTVLTAVVLCLSMSACGSGSDDDYDGVDFDRSQTGNQNKSNKRTKGVHQIDVSFSGDTEGWGMKIFFISSNKNGGETKLIYEGEVRDHNFYEYEYKNYSVKTTDEAYMLVCEVHFIRKSPDAKTVEVKMSSKVNDKNAYSEKYVADPKYREVHTHFCSEILTDRDSSIYNEK